MDTSARVPGSRGRDSDQSVIARSMATAGSVEAALPSKHSRRQSEIRKTGSPISSMRADPRGGAVA